VVTGAVTSGYRISSMTRRAKGRSGDLAPHHHPEHVEGEDRSQPQGSRSRSGGISPRPTARSSTLGSAPWGFR